MWIGRKHDNTRLPVVLAGGLGGTLETGRTLDYLQAGDDNRKLCSLCLSLMDRMGIHMDQFGDADKPRDQAIADHFNLQVKLIRAGKGAQRKTEDYYLTRYACYLIVQNAILRNPLSP